MHRPGPLRAALTLAAVLAPSLVPAAPRAKPRCPGRYATSPAALSEAARDLESRPRAGYVLCLRATAVFESVSYGPGGRLRRQYHVKVRHGTGFAYRAGDGRVLVATNHHVIDFPDVTGDADDVVDGVPGGALRVRAEVRVVGSEADPEDPSQPLLSTVLVAHALDLAILAGPPTLPVMPYRLGRSADLRVGDAVLVRGYPLGAFAARNAGSVIGLAQRDTERGWDHEDFAVDALLNLGSSGSPVLAIACDTGEPELVGIYHAGYKGAQGLNVVIAVDGLREALLTLKAPAPAPAAPPVPRADPALARTALEAGPVTFPFGGRTVLARRAGQAVAFSLLDPAWPLSERVELQVVDGGGDPAPGAARELRAALWEQLALVVEWRRAERAGEGGAARREQISGALRELRAPQDELVAALHAGAAGLTRDPAGAIDSPKGGRDRVRGAPDLATPTVNLQRVEGANAAGPVNAR
ncbi:MAG: serine protease [Anaeromyxobacteraceae bacterium]